jgi:hypothetical protein
MLPLPLGHLRTWKESVMRLESVVVFGALVAACSSNKPATEPVSYFAAEPPDRSTTTTVSTSRASELTPSDYQASSSPPTEEASGDEQGAGTRDEQAGTRAPGVKSANEVSTVTPGSQGKAATDLEITQKIRDAVVAEESLSFEAKNVKILTNGGKVTLRGPVKTEAEHASVVGAARRVAGGSNVIDRIEVRATPEGSQR